MDMETPSIEYLFVKVKIGYLNYIVGVFYRAPNAPNEWLNEFEQLLSLAYIETDNLIIMGDFNSNLLDLNSPTVKRFKDILFNFNLKQIIECPTRVTSTSSSLIDLISVNKDIIVHSTETNDFLEISDHVLVSCVLELDLDKQSNSSTPILTRDFKIFDIGIFNDDSYKIDLKLIENYNNLDDKLEFLNNHIYNLFDLHAPLIKITPNRRKKNPPYITFVIKRMIKEKDRLHKKYLRSKTQSNYSSYKEMRNYVTNAVKQEKKAFYTYYLNKNINNSKDIWKFLERNNIYKKKRCEISSEINNPDEINNYLMDSIAKTAIDNDVLQEYTSCQHIIPKTVFNIETLTQEQCQKYINKLKSNAAGIDLINAKMMKLLPCHFVEAITHVINCSITQGEFPRLWKNSLITPIAKTKNADNFTQIRPINIIPTISKIIENWIFEQLIKYIEENEILPSVQSGFRKHYSTATALTKITSDFTREIDLHKVVFLVCLDYSKAFEVINHELLIAKLSSYGLSPIAIKWFRSYLSDRHQIVKLRNVYSSSLAVKQGVPQGTILGPLLFSVYTADIVNSVETPVKIHLYADDTQVYASTDTSNSNICIEQFNICLSKIYKWSTKNGLTLNPTKSVAICIGTKNDRVKCLTDLKVDIEINNQKIEIEEEIKSLGVYLDSGLNFQRHVDIKRRSAFGKLRLLNEYKYLLPAKIKYKLTESLILSQIDYCATVYYPYLNKEYCQKLQFLQNACFRYAYNVPWRQHITPYYNEQHILKFENRVTLRLLIFLFNILQSKRPLYLYSLFKFIETNISLRRKLMAIPKFNFMFFKRGFEYLSSFLYNEYYVELTNCHSAHRIKKNLLNILLRKQTV